MSISTEAMRRIKHSERWFERLRNVNGTLNIISSALINNIMMAHILDSILPH
jgi:hypothetical protein